MSSDKAIDCRTEPTKAPTRNLLPRMRTHRGPILLPCLLLILLTASPHDPAAQQWRRLVTTKRLVPLAGSKAQSRDQTIEREKRLRQRTQRVASLWRSLPRQETEATKTAAAFELVGNTFYYRHAYGNTYYVMGEIRNNGGSVYPFVTIDMEFRNSSGASLATDFTYVFGSCRTLTSSNLETDTCLSGGETGFFGTYVDVDMNSVTGIAYSIDYETYGTTIPDANIMLDGPPTSTQSYDGTVKLQGTLSNTGNDDAEFVSIAIALKESSGDLLDVDFTYVDGVPVGASTSSGLHRNESAQFTMYTEAPYTYFSSYAYKTSWDDFGNPISCSYNLSPTAASLPADGGSGSFNVSAASSCSWSASTSQSWIHITGGSSGTGNGTVSYQVDVNSGSSERSGTIIAAGKTFTLTQAGTQSCSYGISPTSQTFSASGGTGRITVTAAAGCAWTATSSAEWVVINTGATGSGNGVVNFTVNPNAGGSRSTTLTVAGSPFNVTQRAAGTSGAYSYTVAGVAHAAGEGGSAWRSTLCITNRSGSPAALTLAYRFGGGTVTRSSTLPAGSTITWGDVVPTLFGLTGNKAGALEVSSDVPVVVTARTYSESAAGTFGQYLPGATDTDALIPGKEGLLPMITKTADFRTNIGFVNIGTDVATVRVKLYSASGAQLGTSSTVTVPKGEWEQINDIFDVAGISVSDMAYATVEVISSGGEVWAYASVVDNRTDDPTTVPVFVQ